MSRGWAASRLISTGVFIRDYLLEKGEAYPYEIWKALAEEKKILGLKPGSYVSFVANYILPLKKAGLIIEVRKGTRPRKRSGEDYIPKAKEKLYYRLNRKFIDSEIWYDVESLFRTK